MSEQVAFLFYVNAEVVRTDDAIGRRDDIKDAVDKLKGVTVTQAWFAPQYLYLVAWTGGYDKPSYWGTNDETAARQKFESWTKDAGGDAREGDWVQILRITPGTGGVEDITPSDEPEPEIEPAAEPE